jgi:hypothetical protein
MTQLAREAHPEPPASHEVQSLRDLSPQQWKSGIAAWLGWLFDGLDMWLYVIVAAPFVQELLGAAQPPTTISSAGIAPGFKPRSSSAGLWAAGSSAEWAIDWAAAERCA